MSPVVMASKTKVNLRELMKKQRSEGKTSSKRINSPLAKYNSLGQLWCVVCNAQVKSEIVWPAHIQGRKHKDNVIALKTPKAAPVKPPPPEPTVPKPPPPQPKSILKRRPDDPSVFPMAKRKAKEKEAEVVSTTSGLPADFFDNSANNSQSTTSEAQPSVPTNNTSNSNLPADFFDTSVSSSTTVPSTSEQSSTEKDKSASKTDKDKPDSNKSNMAEVLPEGFFDDPVIDAKVRNVEVKNTMEEEWSKFQKEMETQQQVSENLQEEDEEEAQIERNIDEIDEQINCFAKVEALRDKQDAIKDMKAKMSKQKTNKDSDDSDSSADEAEFDEFLDWRSKGAWK